MTDSLYKLIAVGPSRSVVAMVRQGVGVPAEAFLESLAGSDQARLRRLFERMAEFGQILNREQFKRVEGSEHLWEFKSFQARILCFFDRSPLVVLTNGEIKKRDKLSRGVVERALLMRSEWMERRGVR